jgi:hypothetical protein
LLINEYTKFLREDENVKRKLIAWIQLLVDPAIAICDLSTRIKRNQYLFLIITSLLTDNVKKFIKIACDVHLKIDKKNQPKKVRGMAMASRHKPRVANDDGVPIDILSAHDPMVLCENKIFESAEWEREKLWDRRLQAQKLFKDSTKMTRAKSLAAPKLKGKEPLPQKPCSVHVNACPENMQKTKVGKCLDRQFNYLLTLAEKYQNSITQADERAKVNLWLQKLAEIDKEYCAHMKGIRNDYIMVLLGYLVNGELRGPFKDDPPANAVEPLTEAIATYVEKIGAKEKSQLPLNPTSDTIESFMAKVPKITEGAFALLSIDGNLLNSTPRL